MAEASKITSKVVSKVASKTKDSAQEKATALAKERARQLKKLKQKGADIGSNKLRETYNKFGFFGYFFFGIEAFIIIAIFLTKDILDIVLKATYAAAGVGGAVGETISVILTILTAFIGFWFWFRFGKTKGLGGEALKKAVKKLFTVILSFVGVELADIIPLLNLVPWPTIYVIFLYGIEFYRMVTQPDIPPQTQEEKEGDAPQPERKPSLRSQLEQKTQSDAQKTT